MKYINVYVNNKWQSEYNLNIKKLIVGNLNTFQEKINYIT